MFVKLFTFLANFTHFPPLNKNIISLWNFYIKSLRLENLFLEEGKKSKQDQPCVSSVPGVVAGGPPADGVAGEAGLEAGVVPDTDQDGEEEDQGKVGEEQEEVGDQEHVQHIFLDPNHDSEIAIKL